MLFFFYASRLLKEEIIFMILFLIYEWLCSQRLHYFTGSPRGSVGICSVNLNVVFAVFRYFWLFQLYQVRHLDFMLTIGYNFVLKSIIHPATLKSLTWSAVMILKVNCSITTICISGCPWQLYRPCYFKQKTDQLRRERMFPGCRMNLLIFDLTSNSIPQ